MARGSPTERTNLRPFQAKTLRSHADTWSGGLVLDSDSLTILTMAIVISANIYRDRRCARRSCTTSMELLKALAPFCRRDSGMLQVGNDGT